MSDRRTIGIGCVLTHRGWFGVCPVYLGYIDSDAPLVVERHWVFVPAMMLSEAAFGALFWLANLVSAGRWEPAWPLRISGVLETPIEIPIGKES